MRAPRSISLLLARTLAVIVAAVVLWHGIAQAIGAGTFWSPCYTEGFRSGACSYLQYDAPSPAWNSLLALWPLEVVLAAGVLAAAAVAHHRSGLALAGAGAVLMSNVLFDYILTPMFNGGYTSADDHPGLGFFGAGCLVIAGIFFLAVGVLPRSAPAQADAHAPRVGEASIST